MKIQEIDEGKKGSKKRGWINSVSARQNLKSLKRRGITLWKKISLIFKWHLVLKLNGRN